MTASLVSLTVATVPSAAAVWGLEIKPQIIPEAIDSSIVDIWPLPHGEDGCHYWVTRICVRLWDLRCIAHNPSDVFGEVDRLLLIGPCHYLETSQLRINMITLYRQGEELPRRIYQTFSLFDILFKCGQIKELDVRLFLFEAAQTLTLWVSAS